MKTQIKMIAALALLSAPLCAQETWTTETMPASLAEHAMVRDAANDRLVVFGGIRNGLLTNETWAYYPTEGEWQQLLPAGIAPSPRRECVAAYDSKRDRMIVFGGTGASGYTNDTFVLDLTPGAERWVELAVDDLDKPLPRTHGNMIVDTLNDRAVLYGGYRSPNMLRDAWAMDLESGEDWQLLPAVNHPTGNSMGNAAIYDPIGQRLLVYRAYQSQLAALSLDADLVWTVHTNATTSAHGRYPAAAYDPERHEMIIHGGLKASMSSSEAFRVDLDTMQFTQLPDEPSAGRHWHTAAYDELRDQFIIVGGRRFPSVPYNTLATLQLLPGAPSGLSPSNDEMVTDADIILTWEHSEGIGEGRYVVEVYDENGFIMSDVTISGNVALFRPSQAADLTRDVADTYTWQVMAINSNGSSAYSQAATFQHRLEVPPPADSDDGDDGAGSDDGADLVTVRPINDVPGMSQGDLPPNDEAEPMIATGSTIIGGGSGEAKVANSAGCTSGSGGHGIALLALLIGIVGLAARRLTRA